MPRPAKQREALRGTEPVEQSQRRGSRRQALGGVAACASVRVPNQLAPCAGAGGGGALAATPAEALALAQARSDEEEESGKGIVQASDKTRQRR